MVLLLVFGCVRDFFAGWSGLNDLPAIRSPGQCALSLEFLDITLNRASGPSHRHIGLAGGANRHHSGHGQQSAGTSGASRHRARTDRPETQPSVQLRGLYRNYESRNGITDRVGAVFLANGTCCLGQAFNAGLVARSEGNVAPPPARQTLRRGGFKKLV